MKKKSSFGRCVGVLANRNGTFTAEEIAEWYPTSSRNHIFSRRQFSMPTRLLADYPIDSDLKHAVTTHALSIATTLPKFKDMEETCGGSFIRTILSLANDVNELDEKHPVFARCSRAWLEPTLGSIAFSQLLDIKTASLAATLFNFSYNGNDDAVKYLTVLAKRLEKNTNDYW
jgi:hypothetical protein